MTPHRIENALSFRPIRLAALLAIALSAACASTATAPRVERPEGTRTTTADSTRSAPPSAPPAPQAAPEVEPEPAPAMAPASEEADSDSLSLSDWMPWNWRRAEEPAPEEPAPRRPPPAPRPPVVVERAKPAELDRLGVLARPDERSGLHFRDFGVNPTVSTADARHSTFSVDTDTASYTVTRSHLERGLLPPEASVRVEEFVNAFDYGYRAPKEDFAVSVEVFPSPHRRGYHVLHVGLKAHALDEEARAPAQLVFVVDTSGSMADDGKLELVKRSLRLLARALGPADSVAIVAFSDGAHEVLPPTPASATRAIVEGIDRLSINGGTNVAAGLQEGYRVASRRLRAGATTRVVLCSDGLANSGLTEADAIFDTVRGAAAEGVFLTAVGVGRTAFSDVLLERLAHLGNGRYVFFDDVRDAERVFKTELAGTLQVAAKDVKVQLEFNPLAVSRYRQIGYENRGLATRDFHDERVDAGEIGLGHAVTALYEVKLVDAREELGTLRIRWKAPEGGASRELQKPIPANVVRPRFADATPPARLSFVVGGFAEKLRGSYWVRTLDWNALRDLWLGLGADLLEARAVRELGDLIDTARRLDGRGDRFEDRYPVANMDFDRIPVLE